MATNKRIEFHSDAGHGWLKVERKLLNALGIADKITAYSYQRYSDVYLEEDCDAVTFVEAYRRVLNSDPSVAIMPQVDPSPIRNFKPYQAK